MKNFKQVVSQIGSFGDIKIIRLWKRYAIIIVLCISYVPLYGQYTGNLPSLEQPLDQKYDYKKAMNGQIFSINYTGSTPKDKAIWCLLTGGEERFRVCQNGTVAILGTNGGYASLNFYTGNNYFAGAVHSQNENLSLVGYKTVNMYPRQKSTPTVVFDYAATYMHTSLDFYEGNTNYLKLKSGRNMCPSIINPNDKMMRFGSKNGFGFWANGNVEKDDTPHLRIQSNSITSYTAFKVDKGNAKVVLTSNTDNTSGWIGTESNHGLYIGTNNQSQLFIDNKQIMYIGMTKIEANKIKAELRNKYQLFVYKGILSEDYAIAPKSTWADFVFNNNFKLRPLSDVEKFINANKHLPDVPSAKEVSENGYSQHDMNKVLLQKIEELTLYILEQQKKIETLEAKVQD